MGCCTCQPVGDHLQTCGGNSANAQGMATEIGKKGTNALTLADINDECSRNGWHVNPAARNVLHLEPIVR